MKICVIGAGVIGVTTAFLLARAGHEVSVIESDRDVAMGASHANGAQLAFTHIDPLASLSTLAKVPFFFAGLDVGSKIGMPKGLHDLSWSFSFMKNAVPRKFQENLDAHIKLSVRSMLAFQTIFDNLGGTAPVVTGLGKIIIAHSEAQLNSMKKTMAAKQDAGLDLEELSEAECLDVEPSLKFMTDKFVGGLYARRDVALDPVKYCQVLREYLSGSAGVSFRFDQSITAIEINRNKVSGVRTSNDLVGCDHVIVCAGNGARRLLLPLGIKLPIVPGRGYSLTLRANGQTPNTSITDLHRKIVFSSLGDRLRIAGFVDFFKNRQSGNGRQQDLLRVAREVWPGIADYDENVVFWTQNRPMTPSGLPIIGETAIKGLFLNVGHGSLGYTFAAGSAEILADLIAKPEYEMNGETGERVYAG